MNILFLAPLFLAGAAAILIPVIVHLTHRDRKEAVEFPSLMFLSRIPYRTVRRQKIRHWLLFAMRSLAVLLLVFAFSRPLLDTNEARSFSLAGARDVVILLDNSYSMSYSDRWARAKSAASDVIAELGRDDRASLVTFASEAVVTTQQSSERAALRAALDSATTSFGSTNYAPALNLAEQVLLDSDRPNLEVVLISDFQKSGWDPGIGVTLPEGTNLRWVNVGGGDVDNAAVVGVVVERERRAGIERAKVIVRLADYSTAKQKRKVTLLLNGTERQQRDATLAPGAIEVVTFEPFTIPGKNTRVTVRLDEDQLQADNEFHLVLDTEEPVRVLVIDRSGSDDPSLYVRRALSIGQNPVYELARKGVSGVRVADLENASLVVLNDVPFPAGRIGRRLERFVRAGGGLFAVLGRRTADIQWPPTLAHLPRPSGGVIDRSLGEGATLSSLDYTHPVFDVFRGPRSGDFSLARFFSYRRLAGLDSAQVLARFDDGGVALASANAGKGTVMLWTSGLDNIWSDFVLQPVFVPFIHRLADFIVNYEPPRRYFTVGQVLDVSHFPAVHAGAVSSNDEIPADIGGGELVVQPPGGRRYVVTLQGGNHTVPLEYPGFYQLRLAGDSRDVVMVAANPAIEESDPAAVDPEEMAAVLKAGAVADRSVAVQQALSPDERERRQGLWWYLTGALLLLLVAETAVSNRISLKRLSGRKK